MLELKNISVSYDDVQVLFDISAIFPSGKVTVLAGPNGSGKTTLVKTAANILKPMQGEVFADGKLIAQMSLREVAKRVAYLPQVREIPDLTVGRMVLHGRFPHMGFPRRYTHTDREIVEEILRETGLWEYRDRSVKTLSGGQRQKVYLAMALAQESEMILLDEPTTFLDISHQLETAALMRQLAERGKTVVMVLHDLSTAMETADQIIILSKGHLAAVGSTEDVFRQEVIPEVFHIRFGRVDTGAGWKYYCERL